MSIKSNLTQVLAGRLAVALADAVHFGREDVLHNPAELSQVLEQLRQNIREEINKKNNPPLAPAAVPPPGSASAAGAPAAPGS